MKTAILLITVFASVLLFACKKRGIAPTVNTKTVSMTFNLNGITESAITLNAGGHARMLATPTPVQTPYLTALFYDASSNLLQRVDLTNNPDKAFSTLTVLLPVGQVYAFFIATDNHDFQIEMSTSNLKGLQKMPKGYPTMIYTESNGQNVLNNYPPTTSIFSTFALLNVTSPSTQTINLTRVVSVLTFEVDDVFPSGWVLQELQEAGPTAFDLVDQTGEGTKANVDQTFNLAKSPPYTYTVSTWPGVGRKDVLYAGSSQTQFTTKTLILPIDTIKPDTHYTFEGYLTTMRTTTLPITTDTAWNAPVRETYIKRHRAQ